MEDCGGAVNTNQHQLHRGHHRWHQNNSTHCRADAVALTHPLPRPTTDTTTAHAWASAATGQISARMAHLPSTAIEQCLMLCWAAAAAGASALELSPTCRLCSCFCWSRTCLRLRGTRSSSQEKTPTNRLPRVASLDVQIYWQRSSGSSHKPGSACTHHVAEPVAPSPPPRGWPSRSVPTS
jgi:hypothetical protein